MHKYAGSASGIPKCKMLEKLDLFVVYFDQLLGAARTQKLIETFFQHFFNLFCSFQSKKADRNTQHLFSPFENSNPLNT